MAKEKWRPRKDQWEMKRDRTGRPVGMSRVDYRASIEARRKAQARRQGASGSK